MQSTHKIGYINLPRWRDYLQSKLIKLDLRDMLTFPVLGGENLDSSWRSLERDDFFNHSDWVIHFADGKKQLPIDRNLITTDPELAVTRLYNASGKKTRFSGAIGGTFPFNQILCSSHQIWRPVKLLVQNDGVVSYILSRIEKGHKTLEEAIYESQWEKVSDGKPFKNLHGIVARDRFILQIAQIFGQLLPFESLYVSGINDLDVADVRIASQLGYSMRLLGIYESRPDGVSGAVEPCLIPEAYLLAQARGGSEIAYAEMDNGLSQVYGCPGSSSDSSINGLLHDLYDCGGALSEATEFCEELRVVDEAELRELEDRFYLRFELQDITGCLAAVLRCFASHEMGVEEVHRLESPKSEADFYTVVLVSAKTCRATVASLVSEIAQQVEGARVKSYYRFIGRV